MLGEINGLTADDLNKDEIVTLAPGRTYRIPAPAVLLKAKLYNLASLVGLDRPQDLRYCRGVVRSGVAENVSRAHRLDFRQLLPHSFRFASAEIQAAVREFLEGLPDIPAAESPDLTAE